MLVQDSSIYKFQRTLFLKLGSYYPPLCGIVRLTNFNSPILTPWCPSGYLGYSFLKFESHNNVIIIFVGLPYLYFYFWAGNTSFFINFILARRKANAVAREQKPYLMLRLKLMDEASAK